MTPTLHQHQPAEGHSASLVVVKVHQVSQLPSFLQILFVRSIDKSLREIDSIPQVVAASTPLPSLWCGLALASVVTPTLCQVT